MANPFEKRATEYLRDDEAFLAIVTPEPLSTFFEKPAREDRLYDRLVMVIGTPGSGKTTLSRLFKFSTLWTLLRNSSSDSYKPLIDALRRCGTLVVDQPKLIGSRIPLEAEYREFWELPYTEKLRTSLMLAMLQARTVLGWLRDLEASDITLDEISIVPRADAGASLDAIGGQNGEGLRKRAREVEQEIYQISAALLPPDIAEIERTYDKATSAYRPFDVIEAFEVSDGEEATRLIPLAIFDDAHSLHPQQFTALKRWLTQREIRVARWILTRIDALDTKAVLLDRNENQHSDNTPPIDPKRQIKAIWMQTTAEDRHGQRRTFRKLAKGMADRYLSRMDIFSKRNLSSLSDLLSAEETEIAPGKLKELDERIGVLQRRYKVTAERRGELKQLIDNYQEKNEDIRLAMLSILLERYHKRTTQQSDLFSDAAEDIEPNRPLKADSGVADGARIHLLHKYDRPYYFGFDTLCDASTENAEQFLQLASVLVSRSETQLIRGKAATLSSVDQHKLLQKRATDMVNAWDFPQCQLVRRLADGIAEQCIEKSLEGNASLGGGAAAFGIPQEEFNNIPGKHPELAKVLQFGVAYNAFVLVPDYGTKKKTWCLIELGGVLRLKHKLTLKRGGFLERHVDNLVKLLKQH